MQAIPTSSHQANKLLQAWRQYDPARIAFELDSTVTFCRSTASDSAEVERRELLAGIVEEIGRLAPSGGAACAPEADTYLCLLEHLSRQ
jgi:hypothetical protein